MPQSVIITNSKIKRRDEVENNCQLQNFFGAWLHTQTNTDKNEIEGEEGVNEYKGIFFTFAFEVYSHMDKQLIAYGN